MSSESVTCPNCGCNMHLIPEESWNTSGPVDWLIHKKRKWTWKCHYCWQEEPGDASLPAFTGDWELERANRHLSERDWNQAVDYFDRVIARFKWSANAWIGKGMAQIGLALSTLDPQQGEQYLNMAVDSLGKPGETPSSYVKWLAGRRMTPISPITYFAIPNQPDFYLRMISRLPKPESPECARKLVRAILKWCGGDYYNLDLYTDVTPRLLIRDEFYYTLACHLEPQILTDPLLSDEVSRVLRKLAIWAAYAGQWDKVVHYNGLRTDPLGQIARWVDHLLYDIEYRCEKAEPTVVDTPDEATVVVRATIRERHSLIVNGHSFHGTKRIYVDFVHDYRFHRTLPDPTYESSFLRQREPRSEFDAFPLRPNVGEWRCDDDLGKEVEPIHKLEEWGSFATDFDEHKSRLLSFAPQAREMWLGLIDYERDLLVEYVCELGERQELTSIEVAGALDYYCGRRVAIQYLQEEMAQGTLDKEVIKRDLPGILPPEE